MRNKKSQLLLFCVIVLFGLIITTKIIKNIPSLERFQDPINMSSLNISPIYIDGDAHWAIIASTEVWCSGSGTFTDPYIIKNLIIDCEGTSNGIYIRNSNVYFRIENSIVYNGRADYTIFGGIKLENTINGILVNNNCSNNIGNAILLDNCDYITIKENLIYNNGYAGIVLLRSHHNIIINNSIHDNWRAFFLSNSHYNEILENTLVNNYDQSIRLSQAYYNQIKRNTVTGGYRGIRITGYNNTVSENNLYSNTYGIYFANGMGTENNIVFNNLIHDNSYGIYVDGDVDTINCRYNLFYNNTLINNYDNNAYDKGFLNQWDNGVIGNFWDDYTGYDLNDDGIGDIPYFVPGPAGSVDHFPIWDDGPGPTIDTFPPVILINQYTENINSGREFYVEATITDSFQLDFPILIDIHYPNGTLIFAAEMYWIGGDNYFYNTTTESLPIGDNYYFIINANDTSHNSAYFLGYFNVIEYWILSPIIIDDNGFGDYTWAEAALEEWCSGSGTWNDPYTIENLIISNYFEGSCIYIMNSDVPFIVRNCILTNIGPGANPNSDSGIRLYNVNNGLIINNNCSNNNGRGILLIESSNNTISYNNASNNKRTGIYLGYSSNDNTIIGNTLNYNHDGGIYIYQSNYNNFSENVITHTKVSMSDFSTRYIELTGQNNIFSGNIFNNCSIHLREGSLNDLSSHKIDTTNLVNGKPIYYYANTNNLKKENFSNAGQVILVGCDNSEISGLNMSYGGPGISLYHCDQNTIFNNTISFQFSGYIKLYSSHQNSISHNSISGVGISRGITLRYSNENIVASNQIINCNTAIEVRTSYRNTIRDNYLDNNYRGMYIQTGQIGDMNNIIMRNIISNNNEGIYTTSPYTRANMIYLNNFINNGVNAENNGGSNYWDNGSIGNYWEDYEGNDTDDDGIGDTPYYIPGAAGDQDNFPIWDNGDDIPPIVSIILPLSGQLFGITTPNFSVNVYDLYLDTMWYTIDSGLNNYTFLSNGTLNQNAWDLRLNGTVILRIYANDTSGNINYDEVIIQKDSESPVITINYPLLNNLFGITAPSFNVEIYDANLDTMWYTLDNGATNTTFTVNGTIGQSAWDTIPDGTVSIRFYANDTLGRIGFQEVTVVKLTSQSNPPVIHGYNILLLLGSVSTIAVIIIKKRLNHLIN